MPNVTVDLRVEADASANAVIFGQGPDAPNNDVIVVAGTPLSAATLSGLIHFWEPSGARGTRLAELTGNGSKVDLKAQLQTALSGGGADSLDASDAGPFDTYSDLEYTAYDNFGEVVLAYIAHEVFGHVQATAAITNDEALVAHINGDGASDAQIAEQLAERMTNASAAGGYTAAKCLDIAEAVLGQDPTRAMGQDNNAIPVDVKQGLSFQEGDVVFIDINLVNFTTSLSAGSPVKPAAPLPKSYTLRLTLGS
jgi:hypothetical protein